jgi:hypothetical protein
MRDQDKILEFLKVAGPILPAAVAKNIKTDILLASAHLSDLSSQGKIKISHLKVGGSPLYYLPGHEDQLYPFVMGNINPKNLVVLDKLKSDKIMRESNLDLLSKVALRAMKDFAVPLHVNVKGKRELFWKWHLLSEENVNILIGNILLRESGELSNQHETNELKNQSELDQGVQEVQKEPFQETNNPLEQKAHQPAQEKINSQEQIQEHEQIHQQIQDPNLESVQSTLEPVFDSVESNIDLPTDMISPIEVSIPSPQINDIEKDEIIERIQEQRPKKSVELEAVIENILPTEKKGVKKLKSKTKKKSDDFTPKIKTFFKKLDIQIDHQEVLRKNTEVDLTVKVPSIVGNMTYFCKAKSKLKCDDRDLSAAYMEAKMKKLPLLFIYSNEISKKAQEMADSGVFENIIVKKLESE